MILRRRQVLLSRLATCARAPGATRYTPVLDSVWLINSYIYNFDGLIDMDEAMRDQLTNTAKLRTKLSNADFICPNKTGDEAMANAVPLALLYAPSVATVLG